MTAVPARKFYTPEEYLALDRIAEQRSEYYHGQIYAMAGTSANHNFIVGNIYMALRQRLAGKPCRVFATDMRLLVRRYGLYTYPDVMVICGPIEFEGNRNDIVTNPVVIFEVLSDSTKGYDRWEKFVKYRSISTFQDYVLVDPSQAELHYYRRGEGRQWIVEVFDNAEDTLRLHSIQVDIPLRQIYENTDWLASHGE